jgi:hypothetical protein
MDPDTLQGGAGTVQEDQVMRLDPNGLEERRTPSQAGVQQRDPNDLRFPRPANDQDPTPRSHTLTREQRVESAAPLEPDPLTSPPATSRATTARHAPSTPATQEPLNARPARGNYSEWWTRARDYHHEYSRASAPPYPSPSSSSPSYLPPGWKTAPRAYGGEPRRLGAHSGTQPSLQERNYEAGSRLEQLPRPSPAGEAQETGLPPDRELDAQRSAFREYEARQLAFESDANLKLDSEALQHDVDFTAFAPRSSPTGRRLVARRATSSTEEPSHRALPSSSSLASPLQHSQSTSSAIGRTPRPTPHAWVVGKAGGDAETMPALRESSGNDASSDSDESHPENDPAIYPAVGPPHNPKMQLVSFAVPPLEADPSKSVTLELHNVRGDGEVFQGSMQAWARILDAAPNGFGALPFRLKKEVFHALLAGDLANDGGGLHPFLWADCRRACGHCGHADVTQSLRSWNITSPNVTQHLDGDVHAKNVVASAKRLGRERLESESEPDDWSSCPYRDLECAGTPQPPCYPCRE